MKREDPTAGRIYSSENQYATLGECLAAAKVFEKANPKATRYDIGEGVSFFADKEYRFVVAIKPLGVLLEYHLIRDGAIHDFDEFEKICQAYTNSGSYRSIQEPAQDDGYDEYGYQTARCIIANAKTGAPIGLLINPPFPNGHPIRHRIWREVKYYLPLLISVVVGIALVPALKELNKLFGKRR